MRWARVADSHRRCVPAPRSCCPTWYPARVRLDTVEILHVGATSEVLRVIAPDGHEYALKRLLPACEAEPDAAQMLVDEAALLHRLTRTPNPHLPRFVAWDGKRLLTEYLPGLDLRALSDRLAVEGVSFSTATVAFICGAVASALATLHGLPSPVVHRDVSPDNIRVGLGPEGPRVTLIDFGIALHAARGHRTRTGVVRGKESYAAPEQLTGAEVGAAADVYALAVTLYECASGVPPLSGWNEIAARMQGAPLRMPETFDRLLAKPLHDALSIDPSARPGASQLSQTLSELAAGGADSLAAHLGRRSWAGDDLFDVDILVTDADDGGAVDIDRADGAVFVESDGNQ